MEWRPQEDKSPRRIRLASLLKQVSSPSTLNHPWTRLTFPLPPADDAKYKSKYKELKVKIAEIEEVHTLPSRLSRPAQAGTDPAPASLPSPQDNTKLQLRILKSKKNISRLRIERAILYDRLQSSAQPTNPFALRCVPHLNAVITPSPNTGPPPPSIFVPPTAYTLADPQGPALYLQDLDARKLAAVKQADEWGSRPEVGIAGEEERKLARAVSPVRENGAGPMQVER